jgi:hypothetical protein
MEVPRLLQRARAGNYGDRSELLERFDGTTTTIGVERRTAESSRFASQSELGWNVPHRCSDFRLLETVEDQQSRYAISDLSNRCRGDEGVQQVLSQAERGDRRS